MKSLVLEIPMTADAGRRGRKRSAILTVTVVVAAFTTTGWAQDAPQPVPASAAGLSGLVPAETPEGLLNTIESLPESWTAWGGTVVEELSKLYGETAADIPGQRAAIQRIKVKLATVEKALGNSQYGSIRGQLISLRGGLSRRIEILEAVLDTLAEKPARGPAVIENAKLELLAAVDSVNTYLDGTSGGASWKTFLQTDDLRDWLTGRANPAKLAESLKALLAKARTAATSDNAAIRNFVTGPSIAAFTRTLNRTAGTLARATSENYVDTEREQFKTLLEGLEKYEATGSTDSAVQVRKAYDALRDLAADGGDRVTAVLCQHYFNSNLHLTVSEGFLDRVMSDTHTEQGGVRDFVLGADVYGSQSTSTTSTVDLIPDPNGAHLRIVLNGTVNTDTQGYKSSVVIYSQGNDQFTAYKDVRWIDGRFVASPAQVDVSASSEPVGASTKADGIPLLGGLARGLALNGAARKRPEAEAIAAERVSSRVGPEFDSKVDAKLADFNAKLNDEVIQPLKSENLFPDYKSSRSTDSDFSLVSRLMTDHELGGGTGPLETVAPGELVLRLHESLINNALDRLALEGKTMTEEDLGKLIEDKLSKLRKKSVSLAPEQKPANADTANQPKAFIFADKDPLRVKIADGKFNVIIRAGFQRDAENGGNIPPQIVTIPLTLTVQGEDVVITRGEVSVEAVEPAGKVAEQLARAGVIKKKLEGSIQDKRESRTFKMDRVEAGSIEVRVTALEALDGWLGFRLR